MEATDVELAAATGASFGGGLDVVSGLVFVADDAEARPIQHLSAAGACLAVVC